MSRMIFCAFFKKKAAGLDVQIYPGALGKRIYEEISKEAWSAWLVKQTMLINEKKLNMMNVTDRQFLEQAMVDFLFKNKEIHIEGYVQPDQ